MKPNALLICLADANRRIGTGHVMRSMALADAWRKLGGEAVLVSSCGQELIARAAKSFSSVQMKSEFADVKATKLLLEQMLSSKSREIVWIVLDGYQYDDHYQKELSKLGIPVMVVDDYAHLDYYDADIILNQNAGAAHFHYRTKDSTLLLLGTDYALMREDLLASERNIVNASEGTNILLTMGGVDAPNLTQRVLEAFAAMGRRDLQIRVMAGSGNPHIESIKAFTESNLPNASIIVQAENMSEQYQWATMAISAAGTTSWELCYYGIPSMLIQIADNQRALADHLDKAGAVTNLGWHEDLSRENLIEHISTFLENREQQITVSKKAKALVDGRGAARVIREMKKLSHRYRCRLCQTEMEHS